MAAIVQLGAPKKDTDMAAAQHILYSFRNCFFKLSSAIKNVRKLATI